MKLRACPSSSELDGSRFDLYCRFLRTESSLRCISKSSSLFLGAERLRDRELEDSEFELGERVLLRILGLGDDDLLCGLTERLRILGDLLRGLADLFLGLGDLLRGLADRLRGLGDRLRTVGECLRGLGERFLEEPLRLLSSSFFGDLPLDLLLFLSLECPLSPLSLSLSLRSFFGEISGFSCLTVASCLGEEGSCLGDFVAADFSLAETSPLVSFFSSLFLLDSSFLSHLEDSFLDSFLSSFERGERDLSLRDPRDDLSLLRLLLSLRSFSLSLSRSRSLSLSFSFSLSLSLLASCIFCSLSSSSIFFFSSSFF